MIPKEIFLSHSSENQETAARVAEVLRRHGIPVWYSDTNIRSAQQWLEEIGKALRRCDWFVILLSEASVDSRWVKMELSYALNHSQYNEHILPIKIEPCDEEDLSWTLSIFQQVHVENNWNRAWPDILRAWGLGYDPNN